MKILGRNKKWGDNVKINICNGLYDDFIIIEEDNIEEILNKVKEETDKRGWQDKDCWSERIK